MDIFKICFLSVFVTTSYLPSYITGEPSLNKLGDKPSLATDQHVSQPDVGYRTLGLPPPGIKHWTKDEVKLRALSITKPPKIVTKRLFPVLDQPKSESVQWQKVVGFGGVNKADDEGGSQSFTQLFKIFGISGGFPSFSRLFGGLFGGVNIGSGGVPAWVQLLIRFFGLKLPPLQNLPTGFLSWMRLLIEILLGTHQEIDPGFNPPGFSAIPTWVKVFIRIFHIKLPAHEHHPNGFLAWLRLLILILLGIHKEPPAPPMVPIEVYPAQDPLPCQQLIIQILEILQSNMGSTPPGELIPVPPQHLPNGFHAVLILYKGFPTWLQILLSLFHFKPGTHFPHTPLIPGGPILPGTIIPIPNGQLPHGLCGVALLYKGTPAWLHILFSFFHFKPGSTENSNRPDISSILWKIEDLLNGIVPRPEIPTFPSIPTARPPRPPIPTVPPRPPRPDSGSVGGCTWICVNKHQQPIAPGPGKWPLLPLNNPAYQGAPVARSSIPRGPPTQPSTVPFLQSRNLPEPSVDLPVLPNYPLSLQGSGVSTLQPLQRPETRSGVSKASAYQAHLPHFDVSKESAFQAHLPHFDVSKESAFQGHFPHFDVSKESSFQAHLPHFDVSVEGHFPHFGLFKPSVSPPQPPGISNPNHVKTCKWLSMILMKLKADQQGPIPYHQESLWMKAPMGFVPPPN